ncbi:hypothetical protein [Streptomyces sp. PanSC19]|nr:hypothetical protein [Streptomyces sp. PanSC19]
MTDPRGNPRAAFVADLLEAFAHHGQRAALLDEASQALGLAGEQHVDE